MDHLWAPWRAEYITSKKDTGCIFCTAKESAGGLLLFHGSLSMVVMNKFPYNNGHIMIAPVRHVGKVEDLTPEEGFDSFRLLRHSITVLTSLFGPDGFNVGMNLGKAAGAGVEDHLHLHIVPRWAGDSNFMPVLAETKVISEHLQKTAEKLAPYFEHL